MVQLTDTIYALSSGAVPAGVAVIRISGPLAGAALEKLAGGRPEARRAALRTLRRPGERSPLDQALILWFPGPHSETGEDMAELQAHGSRAVVSAVFDSLAKLGLRLAEPGEFARRAFANGKLDLTQVEGLADLVAAETEAQRQQALRQAAGQLMRRAERWRGELVALRAEVEARLDFSDEGDVGASLPESFSTRLTAVGDELRLALVSAHAGERVRDGFRVALVGRVNAGKSTLMNALARRDVAIVTDEPGTTRDVLDVALNLGGLPIVVSDTAGLREAESAAEREGVARARRTAAAADLVLWIEDGTMPAEPMERESGAPIWRVRTKMDLSGASARDAIGVSAMSGAGLPMLLAAVQVEAEKALGGGDALIARERQRQAVASALAALDEVSGSEDEVAADLLRTAGEAISRLTGRIDIEDVLDRLFSEFCIGK